MTVLEFSSEFDLLYNNITSNQAPGLDEYEKSVILTNALEVFVKQLYSKYENDELVRRGLDTLVLLYDYTALSGDSTKLSETNYKYQLPDDCWYIVYEQVTYSSTDTCISGLIPDVVPVHHDELTRVLKNPFRTYNKHRVLRLDNGSKSVELISGYTIGKYTIRYISKPAPIILIDLGNDTIDGVNTLQTCTLPLFLHRQILELAVLMAKSIWENNNSTATLLLS